MGEGLLETRVGDVTDTRNAPDGKNGYEVPHRRQPCELREAR